LPKRFVIPLLILRMRFYNCAAKKELRFKILLVGDDDPPDRQQTSADPEVDESGRPPPGPPVRPRSQTLLVQSTASSAALGGLMLFQYA
jgi:hypothetical protein